MAIGYKSAHFRVAIEALGYKLADLMFAIEALGPIEGTKVSRYIMYVNGFQQSFS